MSVYLFVIDGLGIWNSEKKSTFDTLRESGYLEDSELPFLYKVGLEEAITGKGNLLAPRSNIAGSLEGHREMMGYISTNQYDVCPEGVPLSIIETMFIKTNIRCIGNIQGRGHDIIPEYSKKLNSPSVILYSGYDSTVSIAFREDNFLLEHIVNFANVLMKELYKNNIRIRKIIIRQYDNDFITVKIRREIFYDIQFNERIEKLLFPKIIINNKIQDILKLDSAEVKECNNDEECFKILFNLNDDGFYFFNFPDFDSYAHQGDFFMCAKTIKMFDTFIQKFWKNINKNDYIIITSDHGVKIGKSDLSNAHILENVILICLNKYGYYGFDGIGKGLDQIYNILQNMQMNKCFYDNYYELC